MFYTITSERQLIEQLDYNLLFRWFVGLPMDAPRRDVVEFSTNRDRLLSDDVTVRFLAALLSQPWVQWLLSDDHFSPDRRLIEAWGSAEIFQSRQRSRLDRVQSECDAYGENGERLPYYPACPRVAY